MIFGHVGRLVNQKIRLQSAEAQRTKDWVSSLINLTI